MCMAFERECACGRERARIHHGDSVLPYEAVREIYCPACSGGAAWDPATMIADNGWIVEYDMEVVRLHAGRLGVPALELTPEVVFDRGWAAWQGFTPNDLEEANREKAELAAQAKADPRSYLERIREWSIARARRLQAEGWRKARGAVDLPEEAVS